VKVAFASSPFGTPRHRCHHPCEQLRAQGVEADVLEGDAPSFAGYTHVVLNRVPWSAALGEAIAAAEGAGASVLFDVDDLIFDRAVVEALEFVQARSAPDRARVLDAASGIARTIDRCAAGLCATPALLGEIGKRGHRARVAVNGVSDEMVRLSENARREKPAGDGHVRIGFPGGHPGHAFNLAVVDTALAEVLRRHEAVRLVLIGPLPLPAPLQPWAARVDQVAYVDWRRLPFELARLDVCIAPLADNPFNRCKSDIKLLEAALVGIPLVASPVGQLGETIRDGVNGVLAEGAARWTSALSELIEDGGRRARLAETAREQVVRERTSAALGPSLVDSLDALSAVRLAR
jgi:glycosyltransferase involved in cell wall biosynthesis